MDAFYRITPWREDQKFYVSARTLGPEWLIQCDTSREALAVTERLQDGSLAVPLVDGRPYWLLDIMANGVPIFRHRR